MKTFLFKIYFLSSLLAWLLVFSCQPLISQQVAQKDEISELARQSQNPVANMYQVPLSYLGDINSGSNDLYISTVMLKPVIPISLSPKLLLIFRAIVPVAFIPEPINKSGLTDMQFQFYVSPVSKSKFINEKIHSISCVGVHRTSFS